MTNKEFMREIVAGRIGAPTARNRSGYREASNVLFDGEHVYSYGSHYPLLMRLETENGPRWIANDRGYSSSTGRHISYARQFADASVKLGRAMRPDYEDIRRAANEEIIEQRQYISESREKIEARPQWRKTYERAIERAEDRMQNLRRVISICDDAEAYAMDKRERATA